jgi:hypothetical protein
MVFISSWFANLLTQLPVYLVLLLYVEIYQFDSSSVNIIVKLDMEIE